MVHQAPVERGPAGEPPAPARGGQRSARLPRDERRAQLLAAAQEVFVANGYHGAAMDEIAETAHVSKPVLYQHFPSKRELYLALLDSHLSKLTELLLGALNSTTDNDERVQAVMRAYFRFIASDDQAHRLVFESDLVNDPDVSARLETFNKTFADAVARVIAEDTKLPDWRPSCWAAGSPDWRRSAPGTGWKPTAILTSMWPAT